jgi:hypothetical protein
MSMLHVNVEYPCRMSMLYAHTECSFYMSKLHVHSACPCCISMLHFHAECPWFGSMPHVYAAFPCRMNVMHSICRSVLCVHAVHATCVCCKSMQFHAGFPCMSTPSCPCWMSMLRVFAACPCFMSLRMFMFNVLVHVYATWPDCMTLFHVHAACLFWICMLHIHANMSMLHVNAPCP